MEDGEDFSLYGKDIVTEADLRDEYYWKLVADFIGPQSGEGLELDQGPCTNRVLIQVGLLKEDNNFPWVSIIEWLKKIFPMHQTADFRRLIERGIATLLSLLGDSRQTFLELAVNFNFVGPICDSIGVERTDLLKLTDFSERAQLIEVTNGLVLELDDFIQREKLAPIILVQWLRNFNSEFCKNGNYTKAYSSLRLKLKRLKIYCSISETKSQRRNVAIESLLQSPFELLTNKPKSVVKKRPRKEEPLNYRKVIIKEEHDSYEIPPDEEPVRKGTVMRKVITNKKEPVCEERKHPNKSKNAEETCEYDEPLTLLDIAMVSVQKLSHVYNGITDSCQQVCVELLKNHYTLTCKEHPAMADFEEKLNSFSEDISLGSPVEFIHHNANFFVEVHKSVEQQIRCFEKEVTQLSGSKLGRDELPKFQSFVNFTESATSRYIQMVCGLLSPMSCDKKKKSYRKHWSAFCKEKGNPSVLTENSTNRINSYFEASAGLIHHYKEIGPFLSDLLSLESDKCPNIILESIAADANDRIIQSFVCVLAIVYCKILGPYWQLLKSAAEYSQYPRYLLSLYQKFLDWSKDPASLLEPEEGTNVFLQFPMHERNYSSVFSYCGHWHTNRELIRTCLKRVIKVIATSTDNHLKDFLPGGRYSQVPQPVISLKLSSCTFSVLFAEYPFGQSYSYSKNDNKKKYNDESSSSSSDEDDDNISVGIESANESPTETDQNTLPKRKRQKNWADLPQIMDRDYIIDMVERNGGPCKTQQDVDKMMLRLERKSRAEKFELVRCEMLYHKMILNNPSPYLDETSNCSVMVLRLKMSLPRVKPGFSLVLAPRKTPYTQRFQHNSSGLSEKPSKQEA